MARRISKNFLATFLSVFIGFHLWALDPDATFKFGPSMNFPTTERIARITIKSNDAAPANADAGTHLVVQEIDKISKT